MSFNFCPGVNVTLVLFNKQFIKEHLANFMILKNFNLYLVMLNLEYCFWVLVVCRSLGLWKLFC